jgi:uncharacterized protein YidB (DUF937 family)
MTRIPGFAFLAAAIIVSVCIVGGGIVFAMSGDSAGRGFDSADTVAPQAADASSYISQLAKNLGVDEAKLKSAIGKTNGAVLDQAVADGKLTKDAADELRANLQAGNSFFTGAPGAHRPIAGGPGGTFHIGPLDLRASAATFLGLSADQLTTELKAGKSLAEVAQAHGKTRDQLKAYLTTQQTAAIDKAVTDGKLTKDAADKLKQTLSTMLDRLIDAKAGTRGSHFSFGGPGGANDSQRGGTRLVPGILPSGVN